MQREGLFLAKGYVYAGGCQIWLTGVGVCQGQKKIAMCVQPFTLPYGRIVVSQIRY